MATTSADVAREPFRERVLECFTTRAERVGIRRVRMEDLASDLRVSKRTIYEAFPNKEALVRAFVAAWAGRIQEQMNYRRTTQATPIELLRRWARRWSQGNGRISDLLWEDIRTDYPEVYAEYRTAQRDQMKETTDAMRALMPADVDPDVAIAMFEAIRRMAKDERVCRRLGMSMEEVLTKAVEIWARGAYAAPYGAPTPGEPAGR